MKVYSEISLSNFTFWGGAVDNAKMLTTDELDTIGEMLEDIYPDGVSEGEINDLMWFDFAYLCESIGLEYDSETDEITR